MELRKLYVSSEQTLCLEQLRQALAETLPADAGTEAYPTPQYGTCGGTCFYNCDGSCWPGCLLVCDATCAMTCARSCTVLGKGG